MWNQDAVRGSIYFPPKAVDTNTRLLNGPPYEFFPLQSPDFPLPGSDRRETPPVRSGQPGFRRRSSLKQSLCVRFQPSRDGQRELDVRMIRQACEHHDPFVFFRADRVTKKHMI